MSQNAAQAGMKKAVKDQSQMPRKRQSVACGGFTCLCAPANLITVVLDEANTCVEGWIPIEQEYGSVVNASVGTGRIVPARRAVSSCQMLRHSDSAAGNAWADPPRCVEGTMSVGSNELLKRSSNRHIDSQPSRRPVPCAELHLMSLIRCFVLSHVIR